MAHTDLSRYEGRAGAVDLAGFDWGAFDLVVIDESHNFPNDGRDRTDEAGNVVRRSRYDRLLEEVAKDGVRTNLLMLSGTPVNTSLRGLRNQIYVMTEKRRDAFREALGIGDIQTLFGVAQRDFQQWEKERQGGASKAALFGRLGADFLVLLDAVTIARSRDHLRRYYPAVTERTGGFPERANRPSGRTDRQISSWSRGSSSWRRAARPTAPPWVMADALNPKFAQALDALAPDAPLRAGAAALLGALGYRSERTVDEGGVAGLLALLESVDPTTARAPRPGFPHRGRTGPRAEHAPGNP